MVAQTWHPVLQLQAQDFKLSPAAPFELLNQLYNEDLRELVDALADDPVLDAAGPLSADPQPQHLLQAWPGRTSTGTAQPLAEGDEGQEQLHQQRSRLLHSDFRLSGLDAAAAAAAASATDAARRAQDPTWHAMVEAEAAGRGERPTGWWGALSSRRLLEVEVPPPPPPALGEPSSPHAAHSSGALGGKAGSPTKGPVLEAYAYESSVEEEGWEAASCVSTASSFTVPPFPEDELR
jgi:hypothetical protein